MPRSIGSDLAMQHAGAHQFVYRYEPASRFFLNATAFYQASNNSGDIRRFFFPTDKSTLVVNGALVAGPCDISATWLQIAGKNLTGTAVPADLGYDPSLLNGNTNLTDVELYINKFSSNITIDPTYKNFGSLFQSYHSLACINRHLWCSFDFPVMQVETRTNLSESNIQNAATTLGSINNFEITNGSSVVKRNERAQLGDNLNATQAFNNPLWNYGKISDGLQKIAGVADIQCRLGYNLMRFKALRGNIYGRLSLPTSYKPTAKYMFEPILGNAGHWGLGAGTGIDVTFINGKKFNISLCTNLDYLYLLENTQMRSMDLTANGQWSRYLLVVDTTNEQRPYQRTLQPGINFFTRKVNVSPKHDLNAVGSLKIGFGNFFIESGYNFWFKSAEEVSLKSGLPDGIAIAATSFGASDANNPFVVGTFSKASISDHIVAATTAPGNAPDTTQVILASSDLNLSSAAHPKRVSHKIFASGGLHTEWAQQPVQLGIGGSYEFAENNRSLDLWGVFVKFNIFV